MIFISTVSLIVVFFTFFIIFRKKARQLNLPPGPRGLPIFGNTLEINERNICDKLFEYANQYGDIFRIQILNKSIVCLNSSEIIQKAFRSDPFKDYMNDRVTFLFGEYLYYGSQSIATFKEANSTVLMEMRKGYTKALHVYDQEGFASFEKMILSELDNLNERIEGFEGKEFDVLAVIRRSLTNVISVLLSGEVLADDDEDINMFWDFVDESLFLLNPTINTVLESCPWLRYAPGFKSHFSRISKAKEKLLKRFFIKSERKAPDGRKCLVDYLFEEQMTALKEGKEVIFTDERIKSSILETVLAGINTTWSALSSTMLCLINFPEYQDKIFAELRRNISPNRQPHHTDKANCHYLEALELEVHRLFPVLPTFASRVCTKDVNLDGYDIPEGTEIIANIWRVHHDSKIWEDPWEFHPERFLNQDGHIIGRDSPLRKNWMPFSTGKRRCPGEQFARSRYFLYMASLIRKWKFVGVPGKFGPLDTKQLTNFDTKVSLKPKPFFCTAMKS